MFYIARKTYNRPGHNLIDSDVITIRTAPAQVAGKTIVDDGDYLYFGDYAVVAHGRYETLAAARQALVDKFSAVHKVDAYAEPDVVETYNSETRLRLHHNPRLQERVHAYMRSELISSLQTRGWSKRPYSSEYTYYGLELEDVEQGMQIATVKRPGQHAAIDKTDKIKPGQSGIVTITVDVTGVDDDARMSVRMAPGADSKDKIGAIFAFGSEPKFVAWEGQHGGKTSAEAKKRPGGVTLQIVCDWRACFGGKHAGADLVAEIALVKPSGNPDDSWTPSKRAALTVQRIGAQTTERVADDERLGEIIKTVETSINSLGYTIGPDALAVVLDARDIVASQPYIEHDLPPPAHKALPPVDVNKLPDFWPTHLSSPNRSSMSPTIKWWDGDKHDVSAQYSTRGITLTNVTRYDRQRPVERGLQLTTDKTNGIHVIWDETGLVFLGKKCSAVFGAHITNVEGIPRVALSSHPEDVNHEQGVIFDLRKGTAQPWRWPKDHTDHGFAIAPDGGGGWWILAKLVWGSGYRGKRCRQHLWLLDETASPRGSWTADHYAHVTASHLLLYADDEERKPGSPRRYINWMPGVIG